MDHRGHEPASPRSPFPLAAALLVYIATTGAIVWDSLRLNQGHVSYPLDDPYIHMAMAKNIARHAVWGVTPYEFSSTSSSPLWTSLLAAWYAVAGVSDAAPLVLNVAAGALSLVAAAHLLRLAGATAAWRGLVLCAFVFLAAVPTLVMTGMEHTLHGLLSIAAVAAFLPVLAGTHALTGRQLAAAAIAASLVAAVRYEGLFLVGVGASLIALRRGLVPAAIVVGAAIVPLAAFGAWSLSQGWYALPNSVMLKGAVPGTGLVEIAKLLVFWNAANALVFNPHLLVLLALSLAALMRLRREGGPDTLVMMNGLFAGTLLLHLQFARTGWFFRYEGYLLMLGFVTLGATAAIWVKRGIGTGRRPVDVFAVGVLLAAVMLAPAAVRGVRALQVAAPYTSITYLQQYQMGRFVDRFYRGRTVAVNDIGAVNYLADVHLVDLVGLASMDVARLRRAGTFNSRDMEAISARAGVDIAIVYDSWLIENGGVPPSWTKAGEWTGTVPDSTVAFYAVGPGEADTLRASLRAFASELPPGVSHRVLGD